VYFVLTNLQNKNIIKKIHKNEKIFEKFTNGGLKMKKTKENAITLVALVITIIVLLILAGVSIQAISNTGLFENAKKAKEKSIEAQIKEEMIYKLKKHQMLKCLICNL